MKSVVIHSALQQGFSLQQKKLRSPPGVGDLKSFVPLFRLALASVKVAAQKELPRMVKFELRAHGAGVFKREENQQQE